MNVFLKLLCGVAVLPVSLFAREANDSVAFSWEKELELNEVVVVAKRPVVKQQDGKLVYLVKNDPYAKGLDGISLLDRMPRVSVNNGSISVAGKGSVRYIIDGVLMELDASAMSMRLRDLHADNVEKIELLTTPPPRYAAEPNAVYISITTRNETLGTRGSVYGSLNKGEKLREYFSGSVSHTTRRVEMSLDANLSNYFATADNDMEYRFSEFTRRSLSRTHSHLFNTGFNALFKYKLTPDMKLGAIANYKYESSSGEGSNTTDYGGYTSSSESHTSSRPNNAVTITGFYDWTFGAKGESLELTYNYFNRHSPSSTTVSTGFSNESLDFGIKEDGASDYRFHNGRADLKLPYSLAQIEAGAGYTDILNSSDNSTEYSGSGDYTEANEFDYGERIAAAYVAASRSLGQGLWGKIGMRYEHTFTSIRHNQLPHPEHDNYGHLFPTLNISWNKNRIGSFNLSYSKGMGRPNLWELNPFRYYSTTDEYASGNPGLKPTVYDNAEINYYGLGGLYAVVYTSFASDAIGYIRGFDSSGAISTMPYNCLSTNKTGLYASYRRNLFQRWEVKAGGEVFRTYSNSDMPDFSIDRMVDWSGKIEVSTNIMLNRQKTMIFGAQFTHFFPWQQNLINYGSFQLFNVSLRYSMLHDRLNIRLAANDIFGWNKTRSKERYAHCTIIQTYNAHTSYVLLGVSYTFGRDKVAGVWRASREDQSGRTK